MFCFFNICIYIYISLVDIATFILILVDLYIYISFITSSLRSRMKQKYQDGKSRNFNNVPACEPRHMHNEYDIWLIYTYIYLESPTTLNFWGLSRKMAYIVNSFAKTKGSGDSRYIYIIQWMEEILHQLVNVHSSDSL